MTPDPISHEQEITILKRFFNNRYVVAVGLMIITAISSVVITGFNYSNKLDVVKDQNKIKAYNDSVAFSYIKQKNEVLIDALETSNNAMIKMGSQMERMQIQLDFMQRDVDHVVKVVDKLKD